MANRYRTSTGEFVTKAFIDRMVRIAKALKLDVQREEYGYNFCTVCKRNDCLPLDCAHTESVDSCQKNGYAEKAYDTNNIEIVGRRCHQKQDGLNLQFSNAGAAVFFDSHD